MSAETPKDQQVEQAIADRADKFDALANDTLPKLNARQECYKRIIGSAKENMEAYYRRYPERALDSRSKDAEDVTVKSIRDMFDILDQYEINFTKG